MTSVGFAEHFANMPFHRRIDFVTCFRGAALLTSCFIFPVYLRAFAAHLHSMEQISSVFALPDIARAYWVDGNKIDTTALTLTHSVRLLKSSFEGMGVKLGALFLDLLEVIESIGRMLSASVENSKLSKACEMHDKASGGEEIPGSYTQETYLLTKKIEIAMYIAGIAALTVPFLCFSSAYGAQIAVTAEVAYALLCLLHYFYKAHAQGYSQAGAASEGGDGGDGGTPSCGKGGGKKRPLPDVDMTASIAPNGGDNEEPVVVDPSASVLAVAPNGGDDQEPVVVDPSASVLAARGEENRSEASN